MLKHISFTLKALFAVIISAILLASTCIAQEYVLRQVAEIQLPGGGPWDVQHWESDSTYGWICGIGRQLFYQYNLDSDIDSIGVPVPLDTVSQGIGWHLETNPVFAISLCRSDILAGHPLVCIGEKYWNVEEYDAVPYDFMVTWDMTANDSVSICCTWHGYSYEHVWIDRSCCFFRVWPSPPLSVIGVPVLVDECHYNDMTDCDDWRGNSSIFNAIHGNEILDLAQTERITIFPAYDRIDAEVATRHFGFCSNNYGHDPGGFWASTVARGSASTETLTMNLDTICSERHSSDQDDYSFICESVSQWIVGIQYTNGSRRVVDNGGVCIDAATRDTLWQNPALESNVFSGIVPGSLDERLLHFLRNQNIWTCSLYDAADGSFLTDAGQVIGQPQYTIKLPNRPVEIVTLDGTTVRVYVPFRRVAGLTIAYEPQDNRIILRWQADPAAAFYRVYATSPSEEGEIEIATEVYDTSLPIPLDSTATVGFFWVTAEYP